MADTGWLSPGTTVDVATVGTKVWNNPNNAQVSDNVYAVSFAGVGGGTSHYLKATNFGAAIPTGATIDGIVVEFERYAPIANKVSDFRIYVGKTGGGFGDENKAAAGYWSTTQAYYSYGGATDLWSETWTAEDINNATFGLSISIVMLAGAIAGYIDHIRVKVYYTVPGTNIKININDIWKDVPEIKINIGDIWKDVIKIQQNIGDAWKTVFG